MPELPEVESLRRYIEPRLIGRRITAATLHRRDVLVLPGDPPAGWSRSRSATRAVDATPTDLLRGESIAQCCRHGKQLAIIAGSGRALLIHLGMSGAVLHADHTGVARLPHTHATWELDDATELRFVDPRRFGGLWAFSGREELADRWATLGPDALTVRSTTLAQRLRDTRRAIKAALLDQRLIAGVGNIYADEALHRAGIHPRRLASKLTPGEMRSVAAAIRAVLRSAISRGGSTLRDYRLPDGRPGGFQISHKVYGRGGEPCNTCGTTLDAALIAQRRSTWCPTCQPEP